jgi:protein gp37
VSVENRRHGLPRIEHLRDASPVMAFLSIEPLLEDIGAIDLREIAWVIVGGESGPGARPMQLDWVLNIQRCRTARVPFFQAMGRRAEEQAGRELRGTLRRTAGSRTLESVGARSRTGNSAP